MAESFSVRAILSATDNGFASTLKNAMGTTESLGSKLKSGLGFGFLTGVGQQAFSMLTQGASNLIGEIDSSNASWKTFSSNLKIAQANGVALEGTIGDIQSSLQKYAQDTVYSASDMASTYAQLASVGTKNTTKLVKGFGGLAAAAENPQQAMKTLSQQATQMAAKPKVAWEDFKLMLEQTPAGMAAVANQMGMTSAELVSAIKNGEVATEDFFDAISEVGNSPAFANMATEAKTVDQAMDGLKETVSNKLLPSFDVLSKVGISAVEGITDKLGDLDAQAIADTVTGVVDTITEGVSIFQTSFDGVGESVGSALSAITEALGITKGEFSKTDALEKFKSICDSVAGIITKVSGFLEENADTVAKVLPWVAGLAGAFAGFKVLNVVAPGLSSFVGGLALMAGRGIAGLAGKLFGISGGAKKVGSTSAASAKQIAAASKSFLMMGTAVLEIAVGFALLAFSAISVAKAGPAAIGVLFGLVAAVAAFGAGMVVMINAIKPGQKKLDAIGNAFLKLGAAVLLISAGFALLAYSAVQLASAGPLAIGVMAGLVVGLAALLLVAKAVAPAMAAGATGFIAFGAGVLLAAAGMAVLSLAAIQLASAGPLAIGVMAGLVVSVGLLMAVAAALGPALTAGAVGFIAFGAAMVLCGVGAVLAAAAVSVIAGVLPVVAACGSQAGAALAALGEGLLVFGVSALVAGAAAIVLGAGLAVCGAALIVVAAGAMLAGVGMVLIGTGALIAGAGLTMLAGVLPVVTEGAAQNAAGLITLSAGLTVFGAAALVAGAGAIVLGTGLIVAAAGALVLSGAITAISVATLLASASILALSLVLPKLAAVSEQGSAALLQFGSAFIPFGAGAAVAGAAAIVLGAGMIVAAAGAISLATAILATSVATLAASGAIAVLAVALPLLSSVSLQGATALVLLGAALLKLGAGAASAGASCVLLGSGLVVASAGITAAGAAALLASAGFLLMAAALKAVKSSMSSIASNAKKAEYSLNSMKTSVDIVESGLDALGSVAKSAMDTLVSAMTGAASDAKTAGQKVGTGFTTGLQSGLSKSPGVAKSCISSVTSALRAGSSGAYSSGQYIGIGFANGMLSMLSRVRSAANQLVAQANRAIEAKAKIGSPSKITTRYGEWYGIGYVNGITDKVRDAWKAAEELVSFPTANVPRLAVAYAGEMSPDYEYSRNAQYTITVVSELDGKKVGEGTAKYVEKEINKNQTREERKHGRR